MKVKIKRFDKGLSLPCYEKLAGGFDFICREGVTFKSKDIKLIPSNNAIEVPEGYIILIIPRGSTARKLGLMMPNSIGVSDPFFRGNENEILLQFYNFTEEDVTVKKGERIAQGVFVKYEVAEFEEVEKLGKTSRHYIDKRQRNANKIINP